VTVFAIVLCDQIDSKLAFNAAAAGAAGSISGSAKEGPLLDLVTSKTMTFANEYVDSVGPSHSPAHDYYRLEGTLAGYLSAELAGVPGLAVTQNKLFAERRQADIVVERGPEKVVVELKRTSSKQSARVAAQRALMQVSLFLHEEDLVGAVALVYSADARVYEVTRATGALSDRVRIVSPHADKASST
jgi:hypothetical protein